MSISTPNLLILAGTIAAASGYGFWHRVSRGRITAKKADFTPLVSEAEIGAPLGKRVTLLQFSSAFCTPCRATRTLLADITEPMADVAHIDIDAESHLELVRRLDIRSTPTTIILDGNGQEVARAVGAPKREQVLNALASIA